MLDENSLCYACQRTDWDSAYSPCPVFNQMKKILDEYDVSILVTNCRARDKTLGNLLYVPMKKELKKNPKTNQSLEEDPPYSPI